MVQARCAALRHLVSILKNINVYCIHAADARGAGASMSSMSRTASRLRTTFLCLRQS
jgi:hypothetical protein